MGLFNRKERRETQRKTAATAPDGLLDFVSSIGPEDFQFQFFFVLFAFFVVKTEKNGCERS